MNSNKYFYSRLLLPKFVVLIGLIFFCLLPFSGALEIHHVFAEVDHDGHEHSEFDLCQWVQQHTSGALSIHPLGIATPFYSPDRYHRLVEYEWISPTMSVGGSRAPPLP